MTYVLLNCHRILTFIAKSELQSRLDDLFISKIAYYLRKNLSLISGNYKNHLNKF